MKIVCWNTESAPGPKFEAYIGAGADGPPREGEQLEFEDDVKSNIRGNIPAGIYFVHKVRHVYDAGRNKFFVTVEVTDRHPGLVV
jgi:hypothetical protein